MQNPLVNHRSQTHIADHAVVIGASVAGLLAARVLADYFQRVTVLERDTLPDQPELRSGVPQAHHLHVLLRRGQQSLNQFFPHFEEALDAAGVPTMNWLDEARVLGVSGWLSQTNLGFSTRSCGRALLEWVIRQQLATYPNITFQDNSQIDGLLADESKSRITGLQIRYRRGAGESAGQKDTLNADFVVDASGRGSHTPEWLEALGFGKPEETTVNSFLGYASRIYKTLSQPVDWKAMNIPARAPEGTRGGVLSVIENNRWMLTLFGYVRDYPPTEEAGFVEFAQSLPTPLIYEAIKDGEPETEIFGYQRTANCAHHYERMARFPEHFAVMGDAACCFNPVYGQGMTISALGAETLDTCLRSASDLEGLGKRFQQQLAKSNTLPWLLATGADLRYSATEGKRPPRTSQLAQTYLSHLQDIMPENIEAAEAFVRVMNLMERPTTLFRPSLFVPVVKHMLLGNNKATTTSDS
ncbi:MAG: FAD-dependent monooxygenase [Chloroflexota bacterium]